MGVTALRLVDGNRTLELTQDAGYIVESLDLGFPTVRASSQPRPGADGELDQTVLHGASAVSMTVTLVPLTETLTEMLDALKAFCHPARRPYLEVEADGTQRRIRLRADAQSGPLTNPLSHQRQLSWRAPDGVSEAITEQIGTANAVVSAEPGWSYDRRYARTYPESSGVGTVVVANDGNVDAWPVLRLYGPCTDPRVENQTTGERLIFNGLSVALGDWVEVDTRERTIRLNGLPSQSRYAHLLFVESDFPRVAPGMNTIRYYPEAFDEGARLEVRFRSAWI